MATLISPRGLKKKEQASPEDSQAKQHRTSSPLPLALWKVVAACQRFLKVKNAPPRVRQVQLTVILVFLIWSSWHLYECGTPGFCRHSKQDGETRLEENRGALEAVKPFLIPHKKTGNYSDPFARQLPDVLLKTLRDPWRQKVIPVVQFYQRPGGLPCKKKHYIYRNLQQARKLNDVVYFIGPEECREMAQELDIILEPYSEYQDVIGWFTEKIGKPIGYQVRWFVLRAFMERHAIARIFYTDSDVALFANVTELTEMLYPRTHILLAIRWPSLKPPLGPSQYVSTAVSGHVSLWSYEALVDFSEFFLAFFENAVLFGKPGDRTLVEQKAYNDMVPLGWYTFKACWTKPPQELHPQCMADKQSGVTSERSFKIRGKVLPKFKVDSLCQPRWCNKTRWVDEGWCAFDNNFSVQTPRQFFRYRPEEGMKVPTSMHYTYFDDWSKPGVTQNSPVQFLAVHFQAHKKGYLSRGEDPATTWGSSPD